MLSAECRTWWGEDLFFFIEFGKHKPRDNDQMLRYFDKRLAHGLPDMRERFASIIETYQSQFGRRNTFNKYWHPTSTPSRGSRRLSFYVLIDGVWQSDCTLITEIRTLVSLL